MNSKNGEGISFNSSGVHFPTQVSTKHKLLLASQNGGGRGGNIVEHIMNLWV